MQEFVFEIIKLLGILLLSAAVILILFRENQTIKYTAFGVILLVIAISLSIAINAKIVGWSVDENKNLVSIFVMTIPMSILLLFILRQFENEDGTPKYYTHLK